MRISILAAAVLALIALLAWIAFPAHANRAEYDAAMLKFATKSGCMACHTIAPAPPRADGLPPIAPAWRDVARRYDGDPAAADRLTRTVMTGSDPRTRHWTGKVAAVNMPPNAGVVSERDARILVNWILVLVP